jgi:hypothetical protein
MVRLRQEDETLKVDVARLSDRLSFQANHIKTLEQVRNLERMRRQLTGEEPNPAPSSHRCPTSMIRSLSETVLDSGRTRAASAERLLRARAKGDLPGTIGAAQEMAEWRVKADLMGSMTMTLAP